MSGTLFNPASPLTVPSTALNGLALAGISEPIVDELSPETLSNSDTVDSTQPSETVYTLPPPAKLLT